MNALSSRKSSQIDLQGTSHRLGEATDDRGYEDQERDQNVYPRAFLLLPCYR